MVKAMRGFRCVGTATLSLTSWGNGASEKGSEFGFSKVMIVAEER